MIRHFTLSMIFRTDADCAGTTPEPNGNSDRAWRAIASPEVKYVQIGTDCDTGVGFGRAWR